MRPYISDKPLRQLNVPSFSGGVNYRDGISHTLDTQLTDCRNVWFKNGILQTRPGMTCAKELPSFEADLLPFSDVKSKKVYAKRENFRVINGVTYQLVVFQYADKLVFRYYSDVDAFIPVAEITDIPKEDFSCNIFQYNADIYCFCSGYYEGEETPFYIFKITEKDKMFSALRITEDLTEYEGGIYAPIIATNRFPLSLEGDGFEGNNLIGRYYKAIYSTTYPSANEENTEAFYNMIYYLLFSVEESSAKNNKVIAVYTDKDGVEHKHVVNITKSGKNTEQHETAPKDNLTMTVSGSSVIFYEYNTETIARWLCKDFIRNNLTIIAPASDSKKATKESYEKILNMTRAEWFGGGAEGIYGGLHLFMGGNTKEDEKALVCWSDFNKPLYFSENCNTYVGDKAQKVTAFGKQNDSLFIFKERETYATQYSSANSVIEADAAINQSVIDRTVSEVTFPMIQIHGFIGCDCPDTVQLCRNRLVWAHSDGKIYTLASATQWNERSIYEVSGMIEPLLRGVDKNNLKQAISADWNGHYILSVGDKFFLMDYNSYGYSHIYSYTKEDDAQMHIPWWIWDKPKYNQYTYFDSLVVENRKVECIEKPVTADGVFVLGNELYIVSSFAAYVDDAGRYIFELLKMNGTDDILPDIVVSGNFSNWEQKERENVRKEVSAMAQTKLFDFGGSTVQKSIPKCEISFGNNEGNPITVTTITDRGESVEEIVLNLDETDKRNPQFFKSVVVRNAEKLNNRIGYKFESQGNIFIDSMLVHYKILGGSK